MARQLRTYQELIDVIDDILTEESDPKHKLANLVISEVNLGILRAEQEMAREYDVARDVRW